MLGGLPVVLVIAGNVVDLALLSYETGPRAELCWTDNPMPMR